MQEQKRPFRVPMVFYSMTARKPDADKIIMFIATRCSDRYRVENQSKPAVSKVDWLTVIGKRDAGKPSPYRRLNASWDDLNSFNEWQVKSWGYLPIEYMERMIAGENHETLQSEAEDEWVGRSIKKAKRRRRPQAHKKSYVMRSKRSIDLT